MTETSHILLVLLDARCPPIHLPHSLRYYLQTLEPRKEVILVLTKSDLVDAAALEGWKVWLKQYWREGLRELASIRKQKKAEVPGGVADEGEDVQIVEVQSYGTAPLHSCKSAHHERRYLTRQPRLDTGQTCLRTLSPSSSMHSKQHTPERKPLPSSSDPR